MAPAMKVTLKYEEGDASDHTVIKLTLPRKWKEGPTLQLKSSFVEAHNKKHPEKELNVEEVHLLTAAGHALADEDVVFQVLEHGEHVRIKHGVPPAHVPKQAKQQQKSSAEGPAKAAVVPPGGAGPVPTPMSKVAATVPTPVTSGEDGAVTSAAALEKARNASKAFDYSKWDRLDLSDDDGDDCHPNIEKESWKRLMAQKRVDRRKQEDQKLAAYQSKIDKYTTKAKELRAKIDGGDDNPQLLVDVSEAEESAAKYKAKKDHFLAHRKLTADDLCDVAEDHTVVAQNAEVQPIAPTSVDKAAPVSKGKGEVGPEKPHDEFVDYDEYIKLHRTVVDQYAKLRSDEASEAFLFANPNILHTHAEGYLLLLTLDTCMRHLDEKEKMGDKWDAKKEKAWENEELAIARQHLLIQFVLTLSKGKKCDPRDMIKPFFRKTSKSSEDRVEGFEEDLLAFVKRIRNRAAEKKSKGERSPLSGPIHNGDAEEEEEYELAGVGPGGLDPNEVLPTLPESMQEAFISQDTDALRKALSDLTDEEAAHHMERCIASGLWRPGPGEYEEVQESEEVE